MAEVEKRSQGSWSRRLFALAGGLIGLIGGGVMMCACYGPSRGGTPCATDRDCYTGMQDTSWYCAKPADGGAQGECAYRSDQTPDGGTADGN